jgi:hypothetical protein
MRDLRARGYVYLKRAVPPRLCVKAAQEIELDIGARLDRGSLYQEEPIANLQPRTQRAMKAVLAHVLENVFHKTLALEDAYVPPAWSDTFYGRLKRNNFHTPWHSDALNTIFQRRLLEPIEPQHPSWARFLDSQQLDAQWHVLPIFTFWVALRPVKDRYSSHLRLQPGTHALPGIGLRGGQVVGEGFEYDAKNLVGPDFSDSSTGGGAGGYALGDVVVFHCLTVHEANPHRARKGAQERISLDGRVFANVNM